MKQAAEHGVTLVLADDQTTGLWEEHLPAWRAWCKVSNQWRTISIGSMAGAKVVWLGLDYTAAEAGLRQAAITLTPDQWDEVRAIEEGATQEMNRDG